MRIDSTNGNIKINGKSYKGNNVVITGDKIIINGKEQEEEFEHIVNITIEGDVEKIENERGNIYCEDVGSINVGSGDIKCEDISGSVKVASGDVNCDDVGGSVTAMSGDIKCGNIGGSVTTSRGSVSRR